MGGDRSIYSTFYTPRATLTDLEEKYLAREVLADDFGGKFFVKSSGRIATRISNRPDALESACPDIRPTHEFIAYVQSRNERNR